MKNVRREGEYLIYDCEAKECNNDGKPHRVPIAGVMAVLEMGFQAMLYNDDFRAEAIDVAMQYLYQQLYDPSGEAFPTEPLPWGNMLKAVRTKVNNRVASDLERAVAFEDDDDEPVLPTARGKNYLN